MKVQKLIDRLNEGNTAEITGDFVPEALAILANWSVPHPVSLNFYKQFRPKAWCLACGHVGVHQIITYELVDFINHLIEKKKAIEICSGLGILAKALNIPAIDRKVNDITIAAMINSLQENFWNMPIDYPDHIIKMTAHEALKEYQPEWIIGCWVTQKLMSNKGIGQMYGPIEEKFLQQGSYIHCGSGQNKVHTKKRINKIAHYIIEADWLLAKDSHKAQSQMRIWTNDEIDFNEFPEHLEFDYTLK